MAYTAGNELALHMSTRRRNNAGKNAYCGGCEPERLSDDSGLEFLNHADCGGNLY